MPDHYAKLTRAVVEIGTQLRRIADAHTTPVADDTDAPTTTPVPLATPRVRCGHARNWHEPGERCTVTAGENGCGCQQFTAHLEPVSNDEAALRGARRDSLLILLSRAGRGVLTPDEGVLLRQHVETEMRDADTARAERDDWAGRCGESDAEADIAQRRADQSEEQRDQLRADLETVTQRLYRETEDLAAAEQRRDQLAATLREVLDLYAPVLVNGQYAFYQANEQPIAPQDYQRWRAVLQSPAAEEQPDAR